MDWGKDAAVFLHSSPFTSNLKLALAMLATVLQAQVLEKIIGRGIRGHQFVLCSVS